MNEYINIHKIIYIFYNLRLNMYFDYSITNTTNIYDIVINSAYILDENITNFDLIIDLLVHKQSLLIRDIIDIYEKTIELLNYKSDELSKEYINKCNKLFVYNLNNLYINKSKHKHIFFYENYKLPNCIKIINNTGHDINILYSFNTYFNIKKKKIIIKNDITQLFDTIILNKINNVKKYITPIIKNHDNYYINLYDNNTIMFSVLYKNNKHNLNFNKIKKYINGVSCSDIINLNNHTRMTITGDILLNNNYFIQ